MPLRCITSAFLALLLATAAAPVAAEGLWDPGLLAGSWRSDFADPARGTPALPLGYASSCAFPQSPFAICPRNFTPIPGLDQPQPARVFARSNWQSGGAAGQEHWVVSANVEPALDADCNSGPPNQSEPVGAPLEDVFGLALRADPTAPWRNEVVLAVDLSHRPRQLAARPRCVTRDYIPFLAFGVDAQRGNGGPLAYIGPDLPAPVLRFDYRLVASNAEPFSAGAAPPAHPRGQHAGVLVEAQWGGRKRSVWLTLFSSFGGPSTSQMVQWNWALRDSFYYPGAEIVVTSPEALVAECGSAGFALPHSAPGSLAHGRSVPMALDLARLYQCVGHRFGSAPPPSFALSGLHFFAEVGVRERDGIAGLSAEDWDSRLAVAVAAVDVVAAATPAAADEAFLQAFWKELAIAEAQPQEPPATGAGLRSARAAALLQSLPARQGLLAAARWHLLASGWSADGRVFDSTRAAIAAGAGERTIAAQLGADPQVRAANGNGDVDAFARQLFARALGVAPESLRPDSIVGGGSETLADWSDRVRRGSASHGDLLLAAFRLADARGTLDREAEVIVLYRIFLGLQPDAGGIGYWRHAPDMPMRLLDLLYFATGFRQQGNG